MTVAVVAVRMAASLRYTHYGGVIVIPAAVDDIPKVWTHEVAAANCGTRDDGDSSGGVVSSSACVCGEGWRGKAEQLVHLAAS